MTWAYFSVSADAEVAEVGLGHEVGEEVVHGLGRDDDGELEVPVVLGHADVVDVFGGLRAGDLGFEFGRFGEVVGVVGGEAARLVGVAGEDAGDLADAVGAIVEVEDDVVIADEAFRDLILINKGEGGDELVGDTGVVEVFDAADGVGVGAAPRGCR